MSPATFPDARSIEVCCRSLVEMSQPEPTCRRDSTTLRVTSRDLIMQHVAGLGKCDPITPKDFFRHGYLVIVQPAA